MEKICSWGRIQQLPHYVADLSDRRDLSKLFIQSLPGIAYGLGRSYGDVCLNPDGVLWRTGEFNRFIEFDVDTGVLVCEAGVSLRDIQSLLVKTGWMLAVSPGTQFVTVGGAVANDVHGKNHHVMGCFGDHVKSLTLLRTSGEMLNCSVSENADWFAATIGGLGLTGIIVTVELQLRKVDSAWLEVETIAYHNLTDFFPLADESESDWEYTVSWFDCCDAQGRGIFTRSNHTTLEEQAKPKRTLSLPIKPPISLVNRWSLRAFNKLYFYYQNFKAGHSHQHYQSLFYPLDNISNWNLMYGPKGFYQYQCVVPKDAGEDAVKAMSQAILATGEGSFLAVLKTFGNKTPKGLMSFPMHGVTLALDFPNRGQKTLDLFQRLDAIVLQASGRMYAAKDNCMSSAMFAETYPNLQRFLDFRDSGISSAMSRRLLGS